MTKLKKGSKAAKAWGAKMKRARNKSKPRSKSRSIASKTRIKSKTRTMVKRRKSVKRRSSKKSSSILGINTAKALSAMLYGGVRSKTSNMLAPYTSKIPLGNVNDEVGMLAITTLGKKFLFKKAGTFRDALTAGQTIELARIGEAAFSGNLGNINIFGGGSQAAATSGYNFA